MIEFSDVSVCYNPEGSVPSHALRSVSLKFASGEWAFLVGPSGAGKSTLLKLVYAGVPVSQGRIFVEGQDITQIKPREIPKLRRTIGVIFQDFQLLPQKTVWENVAFALQVIGTPQKALVREVPLALDIVGLAMKQDKRPHELSGGEAQRVAIARAIVNRPRLLLADEPTGNLDPDTAWDIAQVLKAVNESGTTVLMATHDRTLVDALGKRVVRLKDGRVVSDESRGRYHVEDGDLRAPGFAGGQGANMPDHAPEDALQAAPPRRVMVTSSTPVSEPTPPPAPLPQVMSAASPARDADLATPDTPVPASPAPRRIPVMLPPPVPSPHGPRPEPVARMESDAHPQSALPPIQGTRAPENDVPTPPTNSALLGSPENPIVLYEE